MKSKKPPLVHCIDITALLLGLWFRMHLSKGVFRKKKKSHPQLYTSTNLLLCKFKMTGMLLHQIPKQVLLTATIKEKLTCWRLIPTTKSLRLTVNKQSMTLSQLIYIWNHHLSSLVSNSQSQQWETCGIATSVVRKIEQKRYSWKWIWLSYPKCIINYNCQAEAGKLCTITR